MWEPRRLTTLWAFAACYRDSFTFTFLYYIHIRTDMQVFYAHPIEIAMRNLRRGVTLLFRDFAWSRRVEFLLNFRNFQKRICNAQCYFFSNHEYTMKNAVFWGVAPCRCGRLDRRFGGSYLLHLQGRKIRERRTSVSR
jgi:hypothetical protein